MLQDVAAKYGIEAMPTFIVIKNRKVVSISQRQVYVLVDITFT